MSSLQVNGDVAHTSAFVDHLTSYPVINDSVETFKSNRYGQKSIELTNSVYNSVAAPVVPYLAKPFEIVKPYVKAADELGDTILIKLDQRFPAVKTPTEDLVNGVFKIISLPVRIGIASRDRVLSTYNAEYKKCGNNNSVTTLSKAAVTTALIITTDSLTAIANFVGSKKEEAKQSVNERANN